MIRNYWESFFIDKIREWEIHFKRIVWDPIFNPIFIDEQEYDLKLKRVLTIIKNKYVYFYVSDWKPISVLQLWREKEDFKIDIDLLKDFNWTTKNARRVLIDKWLIFDKDSFESQIQTTKEKISNGNIKQDLKDKYLKDIESINEENKDFFHWLIFENNKNVNKKFKFK